MDSEISAVTSLILRARILKSSYLSNSRLPKSLMPGNGVEPCATPAAEDAPAEGSVKVCFSSKDRTESMRSGRIGTKANLIAPGKRMLSSMTPVIVMKDGKPVLVTGSPGGRTIINTILCVVVNVIDFEMPLEQAISAPRLHHQWFPDAAHFEGVKQHPELAAKLKSLGHQLTQARQGDAHTIWIDPKTGLRVGAADKRLDGKAIGE